MSILDYIDYRNGHLWVTEEFLTEELPWAPWSISVNTIRNGTRKFRKHQSDRWENHPHIKLGRKVLIKWDTIDFESIHPFRTRGLSLPPWEGDKEGGKRTLINLIQTEREGSRQETQAGLIDSLDATWCQAPWYKAADEWYFQSKYQVNRAPGDTRAAHLAQGVAIMRMLQSGQLFGFSSRRALMEGIAQRAQELDLYGKGLSSYERLRKTLTEFKRLSSPQLGGSEGGNGASEGGDPRDALVSGHYGNTRGQKFDDVHRTVALRYYLGMVNQQKPDKWAAWRDYYNHMVTEHGCTPDQAIKYSRFKQITQEKLVEDLAAAIRHGGAVYDCFVRPFVLRDRMPHSLTLVAGDGWEPGRSVAYEWRNPKTGKTETRTGTMNVWLWYDWRSKAIISHHIVPFENSYQIRNSFRDIIGLWGVSPRSVMVDKKWAEQTDTRRMWEKADTYIQPKQGYSPWTNLAERNNKEANKIHRYLDEFWVNMTHNHSPQSQHNEAKIGGRIRFIEDQEKGKPMKEADFRAMIYDIIDMYNHSPLNSLNGLTPMQDMQANIDPACRRFDPLELLWIFGEKTVSTVRNYQVKVKIASAEHTFLIKPEDMRAYQSASPKYGKVRVYWDERDLTTADIYSMVSEEDESGDAYICSAINANQVRVSASTLVNKDDPEYGRKMGFQKERGNMLDKIVQEELQYMDEIDETMGWDTAAYMNTSQERFKEMHSNAVAQQYRQYHQDREEWEGRPVHRDKVAMPDDVLTEEERYALIQEELRQHKK